MHWKTFQSASLHEIFYWNEARFFSAIFYARSRDSKPLTKMKWMLVKKREREKKKCLVLRPKWHIPCNHRAKSVYIIKSQIHEWILVAHFILTLEQLHHFHTELAKNLSTPFASVFYSFCFSFSPFLKFHFFGFCYSYFGTGYIFVCTGCAPLVKGNEWHSN